MLRSARSSRQQNDDGGDAHGGDSELTLPGHHHGGHEEEGEQQRLLVASDSPAAYKKSINYKTLPTSLAHDGGDNDDDDDDKAILVQQGERSGSGTSFWETLANFIKGNTGPGLLSLPFALANSGYVVGPVCLAAIAVICVRCIFMLVHVKDRVCRERRMRYLSFGELAHIVLGRFGRIAVNASLIVTQFGFCCVYIIFIAKHLQEFSDRFSYRVYALMISPIFVLLSWIKTFKTIAFASMIANLCIFYSFAVIYAYYIQHIGEKLPADNECPLTPAPDGHGARCLTAALPLPYTGISTIPVFFGSAIFAFECIGLVLPMEDQMRRPKSFASVAITGMSVVVLLSIAFALGGYLLLGASVQGSITLNLPSNALFGSVKIALALAFLQSFIVQFLPAIDVIEETTQPIVNARVSSAHVRAAFQNGIRSLIVAALVALSIAIPHLGLIISLIGSLGCGMLALTLPALMHMFALRPLPWSHLAVDLFIVIFGIVGSVAGVFVSIQQLIAAS